jgi:hypothetical protein
VGTTLLFELEQAELASRARLLAAAAEADRRVEAARAAAARIEAAAAQELEAALARLRERYRVAGDLEVAGVEAELARLEATGDDPTDPLPGASAAAAIVAAVLNEAGA